MHIGPILGTSVVDRLVAEPEVNKRASCVKLSPSKLNDKTPRESSPLKSLANKSVDSKIPPGGISDISEMGEFDVLAGRGRVVSRELRAFVVTITITISDDGYSNKT